MGTPRPGSGSLGWGAGTPHSLGWNSAAKISLWSFICYVWMWDRPISNLRPSYQSQCGFFFKSLVVGLPFSQISGGSEWWLFCSLVVILTWLWQDTNTAFWHCTSYNLHLNPLQHHFFHSLFHPGNFFSIYTFFLRSIDTLYFIIILLKSD